MTRGRQVRRVFVAIQAIRRRTTPSIKAIPQSAAPARPMSGKTLAVFGSFL
jgi:hypothetical protein